MNEGRIPKSKVCILTTVHPPFDTRIFHKQAKSLTAAGYEVILVAQHEKAETIKGVQILPLPSPRNRFHRIVGTTFHAFKLALRQRAEVYHFHDPELLPVGLFLKLFTRGKIIYDVHEDVPKDILTKEWLPAWSRNCIAFGFRFFEQLACRFVDRVIGATDAIAAQFPRGKAITVNNYPVLDFFKDTDCDRPSPKNAYSLIYVGCLTEERGIYELVNVLEFIDSKFSVRLKLLGRFYPQTFENKVRSLSAFANVDYVGWLPYQEVIRHLKDADIGMLLFHPIPNHLESMPNKLFEYMAAGLPVIVSNFPLWREIVEGNRCGLTVNPLQPREIAKAVEHLIANPELRREMGRNGRKAVLERYNWDCEAKKLLDLYAHLTRG